MVQKEKLSQIIGEIKIKGIEIGVLEGDTTKHLLLHIPHLIMYVIDPTPKRVELIQNTNEYGERIKIIELKSDEAVRIFDKESVDFVWVDGDHEYEQVKRDIVNYRPFVKPGGFIGGHDYGSTSYPGVQKAVDEVFKEVNLFEDYVWWVNV